LQSSPTNLVRSSFHSVVSLRSNDTVPTLITGNGKLQLAPQLKEVQYLQNAQILNNFFQKFKNYSIGNRQHTNSLNYSQNHRNSPTDLTTVKSFVKAILSKLIPFDETRSFVKARLSKLIPFPVSVFCVIMVNRYNIAK
jgi:hypothetical protein